ncbi:UDP-N-acetylmuramoyl-tripeptide--D-alanyl-D-alanine ligase [Aquibacillus salsiterrae]|uniref:UDP-N-acetylmuramoyl-tripeptide--D-alanyl-D-alanine ligase n=1 Tax=Aquibacillus salsiterrae TaxID=2950439 RepID=A0A9X4AE77_9BACI|nr:UDP-N-acetylmuramoyl-tripeptide--D-alanyl-D-alanine ligase [Aquibacillus salsiterrae]MDC3416482.1 UDP-N-acetylmuramoyl-tripeptide--D-alanyl-D-alanine ligase [Aquibacillus salsiterrae]
MLFSTDFLTKLFPNHKGVVEDDLPILQVTTDSREKTKKSLFVPLKGDSFDGHDFIKDAFTNGAVAILWEKDRKLPSFLPTQFPVFFVEDTLQALQQLAHRYRWLVNPIVIGVTGSNGKTTTKDIIGSVLETKYKTYRTEGNYNNHIGLPLTILSMARDTEVLVVEMGMNHFGEIELLSKIANPNFAVITNIGESHIEFLGSREGIAQAKTEIVAGLDQKGTLYIDGDERLLEGLHSNDNVVTIGFKENNDLFINNYQMNATSSSFHLDDDSFELNMLGKHNVKNAAFAIAIAKKLDVSKEQIQSALNKLTLTGMRFELIKGKNNATIINDAYNASPTSMKASIEIIKQMTSYQKKVLVLGDMFEMGQQSQELHRSVVDAISSDIDVVYTIGSDSKVISDEVAKLFPTAKSMHFDDKEKLIPQLVSILNGQTVVLLKASRGMKLESIVEALR